MISVALLIVAGLAAVAGVWPMALVAALLGALVGGAQRVDGAVSEEADGTPAATTSAVKLLLMWTLLGLLGAGLLFLAIGATLAAL